MPDAKSTKSLAELLKGRVRLHYGDDSPISPLDLYQEFLNSGLGYKGLISSGYSEGGLALSAKVSIDVGQAFMPGLLSMKAEPEAKGQWTTQVLILVQQQPDVLHDYTLFGTTRPMCLMRMAGAHIKAEVTFNLSVSVGLPGTVGKIVNSATASVGAEEVSLHFDAGAKVGVHYKGEYLSVATAEPYWFPSAMDSAFVEKFIEVLGPGDKTKIKEAAAKWLQEEKVQGISTTWRKHYQTGNLLKLIDDHLTKLDRSSEKWLMGMYHKKQLQAVIYGDRYKLKTEVYNWLQDARRKQKYHYTIELSPIRKRPKIANLRVALGTVISNSKNTTTDHKKAEAYDKLLQGFKKDVDDKKDPNTVESRPLCKLRLWGHEGGGDASAIAKLGFAGKVRGKGPNVVLQADATAQGSVKYTSYRLQTWTDNMKGTGPLVMTQDTIINYRQADFGAKAAATVRKHGKTVSGNWAFNMMLYRSAVAYWISPAGGNATEATTHIGTGLCFGVSVQVSRLKSRALQAATLDAETDPFVRTIARQLHILPESLVAFLKQAWFLQPHEHFDFPTDVILLESAWAAPAGEKLKLDSHKAEKNMLTTMLTRAGLKIIKTDEDSRLKIKQSPYTLQSITARYRIADLLDTSRDLFKLGFTVVVGAGITIRRVEQAGLEAIVDIDTHWVDPAMKEFANKVGPAAPYDAAVPKVALLHQ